jgi:hypothetical protein
MINGAQNYIWASLMKKSSVNGIFKKSASVTVTSSVITLPWDFGKLIQLEDGDGHKIWPSDISQTPLDDEEGSSRVYYRTANTLVLMKSAVTDTYTLKYFQKPRAITMGLQADGSTTSAIILDTAGKSYDDYYNNMTIESIPTTLANTAAAVSDYTGSTRTATVALTGSSSNYYGFVSELPDVFHDIIASMAIILVKSSHPAAQEKPTRAEVDLFNARFNEATSAFAGSEEDISPEEIWCSLPAGGVGSGINFPGQGYTIYG